MYPLARLAKHVARGPLRSRIGPLDDSVIEMRVWPGDLDQNRHLTNGRYLTMMDIGRFELMSRMGMVRPLLSRRWYPVVTGATVRFRRAVDAFQSYQLRTRILGWDDEGFYVEQRFEREGRVHALGLIKGRFLGPQGKVMVEDVIGLVQPGTPSPPLPKWVLMWTASQDALAEELRAAEAGGPAT